MTFKEKLSCSTLTDDQHKRIIRAIDNFFCICFEEEELLREYYWLIKFISYLHSMSFICPREVEKYRVYIKEKYEENLERICQEILKREGVGSEAFERGQEITFADYRDKNQVDSKEETPCLKTPTP